MTTIAVLRHVVGVLLLFVGVWLISRRFWWWYFGIGRALDALEDIATSLRTMPTVRAFDQATKRRPRRAA